MYTFLQKGNRETKKFLGIVWTIQTLLLALLVLSTVGLESFILRQLVGFFYLTFVPGLLILRLFAQQKIGAVETFLYTIGLSLVFIMFVGLFANSFFPLFNINKPISLWPLTGMMTALNAVVSFFIFQRGMGALVVSNFRWQYLIHPPVLFLIVLVLLSITGMQIINIYHNNYLLLVLLGLIAIIPILLLFTRFIPDAYHAFTVICIALALLYYGSLLSNYLIGYDIHSEYYFANLVQTNQLWDSTIGDVVNGMLSIVMLAPAYSIICDLDLIWVFKIIYPFLYAMVPLGIYQICRQQTDSRVAFLAAFFFMAVFTFTTEMISLARQQVAELFLVLLVLVLINKSMNRMSRSVLCLIFSISLIVSHYSVSYLFLFVLLVTALVFFIVPRVMSLAIVRRRLATLESESRDTQNIPSTFITNEGIAASSIMFYLVVCLAWYMWQSAATPFISLVQLTNQISTTVFTELLSLTSSQALWLIITEPASLLHIIAKYLHLFTILLVTAGIMDLLIRWRTRKFNIVFAVFAVISFVVVAVAIPLPYFAKALNTTRLYHLNLIFLAPFCVYGAMTIYEFVIRKRTMMAGTAATPLKALSVLLAIFLLFNTGVMYDIAKDPPVSISLSAPWIIKHADAYEKARFYSAYNTEGEVLSARWLSKNAVADDDSTIYATFSDEVRVHSLTSYGMIPRSKVTRLEPSMPPLKSGSYVYLQHLNVVEKIGTRIIHGFQKYDIFDMRQLNPLLEETNKIYANGGSDILIVH